MSTDLSRQNDASLVPLVENPYEQDTSVLTSISGSGFLPLLQLCSGKSEAVMEEHVPMNHYAIRRGKEDYVVLEKEIDILIITWRPRALDTSDRSNIRSSFDVKSELFLEIKKKSGETNSGCQFGPEYLVWIPSERIFATFYMGSKTARNESRKVHQLCTNREGKFVGGPITLKSRGLSNTSGQKWQAPLATRCSTPFDVPDEEMAIEMQTDFLAPREQPGAEKIKADVAAVVVDR
jgi:hypothetical protein